MTKKTIAILVSIVAIVLIIGTYITLNNGIRKKLGQKLQASTGINPFLDYSPNSVSTVAMNNPLNIRHTKAFTWQGEDASVADGAFAKFDTLEHGIRAAIINLHTYVTKEGVNTIRGVIAKWAPPTDNNDDVAYEAVVLKQLPGLSATDVLTGAYPQLAELAWAMSGMEQGFDHQPSKDTFMAVQQKYFHS